MKNYPSLNNQSIKSWAEDDRPREKLMMKGRTALSDAELLAILIGSGTKSKSAVELSQEMLEHCEFNLQEFSRLNLSELCRFKGIGEAKAITILAALELGRRRKEHKELGKIKLITSKATYEYVSTIFQDLVVEEFHIILLTRANEVIKTIKISQGGLSATVVDGKIIFKAAIDHLASTMILCHNHPSGANYPSHHDKGLTKKLVEFGKMVDLPILDHVIYTEKGYYSFADQGEI